jgi:hypothetical protein
MEPLDCIELAGSKVLDESGEPLRVFHGTDRVFDEFDPKTIGLGHDPGPGFYFTDSPQSASEYALGYRDMEHSIEGIPAASQQEAMTIAEEAARKRGLRVGQVVEEEEGSGAWTALLVPPDVAPNVRTAYLHISKPFDIDKPVPEAAQKRIAGALPKPEGFSVTAGASGEAVYDRLSRLVGRDKANDVLRRAGFDGITHVDFTMKGSREHRVWIAFESSQIHAAYEGPFKVRRIKTALHSSRPRKG